MAFDDLQALIDFLRRNGVVRYRADGVEIDLGPLPAAAPAALRPEAPIEVERLANGDMPPTDDLLMWSAGGPLPSEEREAAAKTGD